MSMRNLGLEYLERERSTQREGQREGQRQRRTSPRTRTRSARSSKLIAMPSSW